MTNIFLMNTHFKLHTTQLKQLTQTQIHPLHYFNADSNSQTRSKCKKIDCLELEPAKILISTKYENLVQDPASAPQPCT